MHTRLVLLLHLLFLNLLEHRSLVTTFPDSLFGIFTPALPSELGTSGDKPGLTKVHTNNTAMTISNSSSRSQIRDSTTHLGPEQLVNSLQVLSDSLGDKSPHGDGVGERQDTEDDVVLPSDVPKSDRADLTDQEVYIARGEHQD
jgi:hypothetical protein